MLKSVIIQGRHYSYYILCFENIKLFRIIPKKDPSIFIYNKTIYILTFNFMIIFTTQWYDFKIII